MTTCLVLAHNYGQFRQWCIENRIDYRKLVCFYEMEQVRGLLGYDLIFLEGYDWKFRERRDEIDLIANRAAHCYYWDTSAPITDDGMIVSWRKLTKEERET